MDQVLSNKEFYKLYHDKIFTKRFDSPFPIRKKVHRKIYDSILQHITPGMKVLDAGCGEGVLSFLMAEKGAVVTGIDLSEPNIENAKKLAQTHAPSSLERLTFLTGDSENLPFEKNSFDMVVSNHVLEHVPDFDKGLREVIRVAKDSLLIAIPTCTGPLSLCLLGRGNYWQISKRVVTAIPFGFLRVAWAWLQGVEGVDETYAGGNTHIFRFPWVLPQKLEDYPVKVLGYEAQTLHLPYIDLNFNFLCRFPFFRNMGLGTLYRLKLKKERPDPSASSSGELA